MRRSVVLLSLVAALSCTSCSSKISSALDPDLQNRLSTMRDCFPELYPFVDGLFDLAQTWRLQTAPLADPAGLTWSEQVDGSIEVVYTVNTVTLNATIRFYSPTGIMQDLDLGAAATLSEAVAAAATELATLFGTTAKFMTADWTLTGASATGSGQLTGILGGTANQNELQELRTTAGTPNGGPPPTSTGQFSETHGSDTCQITFQTAGLQTDTVADQQYPIGAIDFSIAGPASTVTGTITFDGTVHAAITVTDVPGSFGYDLETGSLVYNR